MASPSLGAPKVGVELVDTGAKRSRQQIVAEIISNIRAPRVSAEAVFNLRKVIRAMFSRLDMTILARLHDRNLTIEISQGRPSFEGRASTEHSERANSVSDGGKIQVLFDEKNLLPRRQPLPKGAIIPVPIFSVMVHELGHAVEMAMTDRELAFHKELFDRRTKDPTLRSSTNFREYFANMTEIYFGVGELRFYPGRGIPAANSEGRQWIRKNDPQMYKELLRVYGPPSDLSKLERHRVERF